MPCPGAGCDQGFLDLLHPRLRPVDPGISADVPAERHDHVCAVLHDGQHPVPGLYPLPHGTLEAVEEDVPRDTLTGDDRCYSLHDPDAVGCPQVAQERLGHPVLHLPVLVHDLVLPLLHSLCKGRRHQDRHFLHLI